MKVVVDGEPVKDGGTTPETKKYRLRANHTHTHNGKAVAPGEIVELTDKQAMSFRDKFEPAEKGAVKAVDAVAQDGTKMMMPPGQVAAEGERDKDKQ